jgi:hypothetical protein
MDGSGIFNFLGGITTLFVIVVVLNNSKGIGQILTALGKLYGTATKASVPGH